MYRKKLLSSALLALSLLLMFGLSNAAARQLPAQLLDLNMVLVGKTKPLLPNDFYTSVNSSVEIMLNEAFTPQDEIRLSTVMITPRTKKVVPIVEAWLVEGADCTVAGLELICHGTDDHMIGLNVRIGYKATALFCPADGWLLQNATYTIGGVGGDLLATWPGPDRIPCQGYRFK